MDRALFNPPGGGQRATTTEPVSVAVLIPCYNEGLTIADVVRRMRTALPQATVIVYDNNSTDCTADKARDAGAKVFNEPLQGKGNVVRRMFRDVDADFYILIDGDDTYDAAMAPVMLRHALRHRVDMVNCVRAGAEGNT